MMECLRRGVTDDVSLNDAGLLTDDHSLLSHRPTEDVGPTFVAEYQLVANNIWSFSDERKSLLRDGPLL